MPREVSRRTSIPPEQKARVSRPDIVGRRDLDPRIVEDRPDPAAKRHVDEKTLSYVRMKEHAYADLQRARNTDRYLAGFSSTEGGK